MAREEQGENMREEQLYRHQDECRRIERRCSKLELTFPCSPWWRHGGVAVPLQPMKVHEDHLQPMEETLASTGGCLKEVCEPLGNLCWSRALAGPWGAMVRGGHTGAGFQVGCVAPLKWGQAVPEVVHLMEEWPVWQQFVENQCCGKLSHRRSSWRAVPQGRDPTLGHREDPSPQRAAETAWDELTVTHFQSPCTPGRGGDTTQKGKISQKIKILLSEQLFIGLVRRPHIIALDLCVLWALEENGNVSWFYTCLTGCCKRTFERDAVKLQLRKFFCNVCIDNV